MDDISIFNFCSRSFNSFTIIITLHRSIQYSSRKSGPFKNRRRLPTRSAEARWAGSVEGTMRRLRCVKAVPSGLRSQTRSAELGAPHFRRGPPLLFARGAGEEKYPRRCEKKTESLDLREGSTQTIKSICSLIPDASCPDWSPTRMRGEEESERRSGDDCRRSLRSSPSRSTHCEKRPLAKIRQSCVNQQYKQSDVCDKLRRSHWVSASRSRIVGCVNKKR